MPPWLMSLIAADLAITALVLWFVFARRREQGPRGQGLPGVDFRAMAAFTEEMHPRVGEMVRSRWSGDGTQLPGVLAGVLDELERECSRRRLRCDRPMLKLMLARSLAKHGVGSGTEVRRALERVA